MIGQILWRGTPTSQNSSSTSSNPHILHLLLFSLRVLKTASLSFNFIAFKIHSSQNSFRCFISTCNVFRSSLVLNFPACRSQQTALWELISTELAFIRTLKVIQDVSQENEQFENEYQEILSFYKLILSIVFCKICFVLCVMHLWNNCSNGGRTKM